MTDQLFDIPAVPEPRLTTARRRMEAAQRAYDEAVQSDEDCDGFGVHPSFDLEVRMAREELLLAERERLEIL